MYRGKFQNSYTNPNLKILLLENLGVVTEHLHKLSLMLRNKVPSAVTNRSLQHVKDRVEYILKTSKFFEVLQSVPRSLKSQSSGILRAWAHQCECVVAQRLRRGQQMFCLYSKLWEERALREFIKQMRNRVALRGKDLVFGAIGAAVYDWKTNRITDDEIKQHLNELDYVKVLKDQTVDKESNNEADQVCDSSLYNCESPSSHYHQNPQIFTYDDWKVFIEKQDLIVWRRLHASGHYEYKVYGSYNDVSAEDFLNVQVDTEYRRQWDSTAVVLDVVESDPDKSTNSDIVYWEMLWPRLFANRDYVFNRRYFVDHKSKTVLLISRGTEHPMRPKVESKHRVKDYWSYMVIKPYSDLNKPGIEFSLTYFDNPGVNIPATVTAWVAMRAMPDFLERLRESTKKYKNYCKQEGVKCVVDMAEVLEEIAQCEETYESGWELYEDIITDNTIFEAQPKLTLTGNSRNSSGKPTRSPPQNIKEDEGNSTPSPSTPSPATPLTKSSSFWRYLHPNYYFS